MDLNYTPEERAFRDEVRSFLKEKLTKRLSDKVRLGKHMSKEDYLEWHGLLREKGWLAPNWPKPFGGAEMGAVQRHILDEETTAAFAPRTIPFGLHMLGLS
jgi:alkylation response protein AidB-like acyl-CoA dehydrogenase